MKRKGKQRASKSSGRFGLKSSLKANYDDSQILRSDCGSSDKSPHTLSKTPDDTSSESLHSRSLRNNSGGDDHSSSQVDYNGRRGKDRKERNEDVDQNTFKNFADDRSSESRDREGSFPMGLSSEHELPYDDEPGTRETSSNKDLSGSQNSVFVEPRQPDKVTADYTTSHIHRKVNKRELKALLKQTKKKPSTVDESVIAAIDELAVHLKDNCMVEMKPIPRRPIPVAALPLPVSRQPDVPSRRGIGARRGGRRGRGIRRGGLSSPTSVTSTEQTILPASWVPLLLPNPLRNPVTSDSDNESSEVKSRLCTPWLHQLPESRVHRFVVNMRRLLVTLQNPSEISHSPKKPINLIDLTIDKQNTSDSLDDKFKQSTPLNSSVQNSLNTVYPETNCDQLSFQRVEDTTQRDSTVNLNPNTDSSTKLEPVFIEDTLHTSCTVVSHLTKRRGRGKRHHGFHRGISSAKSNNKNNNICTSSSVSQPNIDPTLLCTIENEHVQSGHLSIQTPKLTAPKNKSRVSRELRGLVTWDAVMAEQRKREQELKEIESKGCSVPLRPSEVTLSVVTELIASVEEESLTPKLRRTRQSSGSAPSHTTHSVVGSETASMQTTVAASEPTAYELTCRTKPSESSSITAYSGLSTEASSVSSDNVTAIQKPIDTKIPVDNRTDTNEGESSVNRSTCEHRVSLSVASETSGQNCEIESACITKYSPISVEQEPNESQNISFEQLEDSVHQSSTVVKQDFSPQKSPGRRRKKNKGNRFLKLHNTDSSLQPEKYTSNDSLSCSAIPGDSQQHQQLDITMAASALPNSMNKRRRQAQHSVVTNTADMIVTDNTFSEQSICPTETNISDTCDIVTTSASSSVPNSLRRSSASRHSALPPRKRYKVGIDTSDLAETHISSVGDVDNPTEFAKSSPDESNMTVSVINLTGSSSVVETGHHYNTDVSSVPKRGRGRPSRRSGKVEPIKNVAVSPCLSSDSVSVTCDRPKREAAVIGFASLVAANLNNTGVSVNSAPETLDTTNIKSESVSLSSSNLPINYAEHHQQQQGAISEIHISKPVVPRGRGRPPKLKPSKLSNTEFTLNSSTLDSGNKLEPILSRPKRSALSSQSTIDSPLVASSIACSQQQQQQKEEEEEKQVNTSNQQVFDNDNKRIVVIDVPSTDIMNNRKTKDDTVLSSCKSDSIQQFSSLSMKSSKSLTVSSIKQMNKKQIIQIDHKIKPVEVHMTNKKSMIIGRKFNKNEINQKLSRLPSRNSFFHDSLISSLDQISFLKGRSLSGPLYELFCKFFNEPDPLEPVYRLCAPIIYLPSPDRYPEFYRFTLSSHLSGSGLQVKFTTDFINRIFSPLCNLSNETIDDEIYHIEFPSLCLASIASRFVMNPVDDCSSIHSSIIPLNLKLSEVEESYFKIVTNVDVMEGLHLLDLAMDNMFSVWEAFTGRRSWFGRRLMQLKSVYVKHRTNLVECLQLGNCIAIAMPKSLAPSGMKFQNSSVKKKTDRRALERGAEVIRCLCGFRVEGGHVMVQCDRCASWQHLPCLWWALSLAIRNDSSSDGRNSNLACICQTALIAAQAVGGGGGSSSDTDIKSEGDREVDAPYICPVCLKLDNLTKEYPRSLSAAMTLNDLDAVFNLQDSVVKGEHEFWTLESPDGTCQIRTDDYAFINRFWLNHLNTSQDLSKEGSLDIKCLLEKSQQSPVKSAYDRVIIRIYRLWKDINGIAWLEGGLFLRPYDLPQSTNVKCPQYWHLYEVVYDEARRVILPLNAWIGRCTVLCPSAYRIGRPADLLSIEHIHEFISINENCNNNNNTTPIIDELQHFFVCEKLFEQSFNEGEDYRFDEISPGYLKVNMKPYCFLRKPDNQCIRGSLPRQYSSDELLIQDQTPFTVFVKDDDDDDDKEFVNKTSPEEPTASVSSSNNEEKSPVVTTMGSLKQKGEKLARVVDWLERKRQTNALQSTITSSQVQSTTLEIVTGVSCSSIENESVVDDEMLSGHDLCSSSSRFPSRSNRGRGRGGAKSVKSTPSNPISFSEPVINVTLDEIVSFSDKNESMNTLAKRARISEMSPQLEDNNISENSLDKYSSLIDSSHICNEVKISSNQISEDSISPNGVNTCKEENIGISSSGSSSSSSILKTFTVINNECSPVSMNSTTKIDFQNDDSMDRLMKSLSSSSSSSNSNNSQFTSPNLSIDDHSIISSSCLGSSRKRKRSVTRKRLIPEPTELLNHITETIVQDNNNNNNTDSCLAVMHTSKSPSIEHDIIIHGKSSIQLCQHYLIEEYDICLNLQPLNIMNISSYQIIDEMNRITLTMNKPVVISMNNNNNSQIIPSQSLYTLNNSNSLLSKDSITINEYTNHLEMIEDIPDEKLSLYNEVTINNDYKIMITEVEMFLPIVNNQATFIHQCQDIALSINNPNEIFIHEKECKSLTKFAVETLVSEDYSTNLNQINYKLIDNSLYQSNEFNNNEKVSNVYFTQNPVNQSTIIECNDSLLNKDEILQTIDTEPVVVSSVMLMDDKSMPMSSSSISPQIDIGTPLLDENTDLMEEISNNNNNGVGSGGSSNLPVDLQPIKITDDVKELSPPRTDHPSSSSSLTKIETELHKSRQHITPSSSSSHTSNNTGSSSSSCLSKKPRESSRDYGGYYENRHHSHSYRNSYHQSKSSNNFDQYRSSTSKIPSYYIHHSQHNSRYDRKHQHQQLKENSHRHDEYNSRYRDSSSYRSRDRDDHTTSDNSSYSRHNHGDRSISNSSHRHQDRIYPTNNRDSSETSNIDYI